MGEIKGHSEGIWRTFAFERLNADENPPQVIIDWLDEHELPYSWQRYAVCKDEAAHFSFRIEFPHDDDSLIFFRRFIHDCPIKLHFMAETSWDEKESTKRAYELGTKLARLVKEYCDKYAHIRDVGFMTSAFHGMFNDLNFDYREECLRYIQMLGYMGDTIVHGFSLHDIEWKER